MPTGDGCVRGEADLREAQLVVKVAVCRRRIVAGPQIQRTATRDIGSSPTAHVARCGLLIHDGPLLDEGLCGGLACRGLHVARPYHYCQTRDQDQGVRVRDVYVCSAVGKRVRISGSAGFGNKHAVYTQWQWAKRNSQRPDNLEAVLTDWLTTSDSTVLSALPRVQ